MESAQSQLTAPRHFRFSLWSLSFSPCLSFCVSDGCFTLISGSMVIRSSRKLTARIAVIPGLELCALIANLFNGQIYYINPKGFYALAEPCSRLLLFPVMSICWPRSFVTALLTARKKRIGQAEPFYLSSVLYFPDYKVR